jgi:hypothetical protein
MAIRPKGLDMRTTLFFCLILLLIPFAVAQEPLAPPEIEGEAVYVPFPVDIVLDGDLGDWSDIPMVTVERGTMTSADPAENGSFTFALAADFDNAYIMMTMPDQNIVTGEHGQDYWNEDSFEFYFNFSGNLGATSYETGIHQININAGDIGNSEASVTGMNAQDIPIETFVFATDDGWGFEAALPLPSEPEHGMEVGFNAQINGATELDRDVKLIWSLADTGDTSWQNPSVFGRALFFEVGHDTVPMPSEVTTAEDTTMEDSVREITAVNQVGYFVDAVKQAVYGTTAELADETLEWVVANAAGETVLSGRTGTGFADSASGDMVYIADFSAVNEVGTYTIAINGLRSVPFTIANDIYGQLKHDALHYFYQNRSGIPLVAEYAGEAWVRDAGHPTDNDVTCWSGRDGDGHEWEGCDYRLDASGGWYDAGDYGKYVVNGGITVWTLLNWYEHSPESFPDGSMPIPENSNGVPDILDEARWEMDFMLRMQVPQGQPQAGMVHHKIHDAQWAGLPEMPIQSVPNDDPNDGRFLMPPSTAATLNLAATAAQCARIYETFDAEFASRCLEAAEIAWQAALANPSVLYGNIPGVGGGSYGDGNVQDEFFWAAAELFITTGKTEYGDYLTSSPMFRRAPSLQAGSGGAMYWGGVESLGIISLVTVENELPASEVARLQAMLIIAADSFVEVVNAEGYGVPIGAEDYVWGSNANILNNALVMALAYDFTGDEKYRNGVIETANYILGRNPNNQSYVSGYGTLTMEHPHHRFWANTGSYPPPPAGALAGGANGSLADPYALDHVSGLPPARSYIDHVDSYSTNEVAINWNSPLVWVMSYLDEQFNGE